MGNKDLQVLRKIYDHKMIKRSSIISLCICIGFFILCACSNDNISSLYSSFSNHLNYKDIVIKYPELLKPEEWEYADVYLCSEEPSISISIKSKSNSTYSYADDHAKAALNIYKSIVENAETLELENIRVDDKPAYRQKFRYYDKSYMDYDEYVFFEYNDNVYIINMEYFKKDAEDAKVLFDTFIDEIELK